MWLKNNGCRLFSKLTRLLLTLEKSGENVTKSNGCRSVCKIRRPLFLIKTPVDEFTILALSFTFRTYFSIEIIISKSFWHCSKLYLKYLENMNGTNYGYWRLQANFNKFEFVWKNSFLKSENDRFVRLKRTRCKCR